jgi:tetratricopeptide (TPR) repeat protein
MFFLQFGIENVTSPLESRPPVRVIGFRSPNDYDVYRLRPAADAYYAGTETRDYIVMPRLGADEFGVAAHEFAHLAFHAAGLHFPLWLSEGLAEFFATVRIGPGGCEVGGEFPAHARLMRRQAWIPFPELLTRPVYSPVSQTRAEADLFYAQSWALTHMLMLSDAYSPKVHDLLTLLASGTPSAQAFAATYGKSLDEIASDLHSWMQRGRFTLIRLPGIRKDICAPEISEVPALESNLVMADLLTTAGKLDRAEALYRELAHERTGDPRIAAALGAIAARRGDVSGARQQWKQALEQGISDANLCYRYALMADDAGLPRDEVRHALQRAIELKPEFDDARYKLALLENNAGNYRAALAELQSMRSVAPARAFSYWSAVAYALTELDDRDGAKRAAQEAFQHASNADERAKAASLSYIAQTDLSVQFTRDASGLAKLVTTRVPHGKSDWNPFIEPGDHVRHADGQLRSVECGGGKITGFWVDSADGTLKLTVPDPLHVLIRNGPSEFVCGAQQPRSVSVDYAASQQPSAGVDGVLRGLQFR